jgi:hypothetical protein
MTKYSWLFVLVFIFTIITLVSQQIETITIMNEINNVLPSNAAVNIGTVNSFFGTYWNLLTFNVVGLPPIISLLFLPLNLVAGLIVVEMVINAIQAIPFV